MFSNASQSFADKLMEKQLISAEVHSKPTFDAIVNEFFTSIMFFQAISEVQEHCAKFLAVFEELGGPFAAASKTLAAEWKS